MVHVARVLLCAVVLFVVWRRIRVKILEPIVWLRYVIKVRVSKLLFLTWHDRLTALRRPIKYRLTSLRRIPVTNRFTLHNIAATVVDRLPISDLFICGHLQCNQANSNQFHFIDRKIHFIFYCLAIIAVLSVTRLSTRN